MKDDLTAVLRSPALPAEQVGGAAAVSAMIEARSNLIPASRSGFRSRRSVAIASVTVASLGVGGLVAAGPGIFSPAADRPVLVPVVTTVEVTEQVEEPATVDESTIVVAPPEKLEGSVLVGESIVVGPLPGTPGGPSSDGPLEFDGECADGNHGATVSSVAIEAEPGKTHGEAVAAAAQSECGKDSTSEGDDTPSVDDDTVSVDDDPPSVDDDTPSIDDDTTAVDDDPPAENKSSPVADKPSTPDAPATPADDKSKSKGDDGDDD